MNKEQECERDEFILKAMDSAIKEIRHLQRLMRGQTASAPCVILLLETAIQLMEEK